MNQMGWISYKKFADEVGDIPARAMIKAKTVLTMHDDMIPPEAEIKEPFNLFDLAL